MGARGLESLAGHALVQILRRDEVRLDDDAIADGDEITERIPRGRADPRGVEPERTKQRLDGGVYGPRGSVGMRPIVLEARPAHDRDGHGTTLVGARRWKSISSFEI